MIPRENAPRRGAGRKRGKSDVALRGSREAMLGADGLKVSRASGIVPAKPPSTRRPPVHEEDTPPAEEEFHASREAMLGKDGLHVTRGLGTVPAGPGHAPRRKKPARKK